MRLEDLHDGLERVRLFVLKDNPSISDYPPEILKKLIVVRRWADTVLLNYTSIVPFVLDENDLDWNNFLRVCRGVVFSEKGELVSFPFHKFFNLNEKDETRETEVVKWTIRSVTEKVDGVMIQIFKYKGELVYGSRHGLWSDASQTAVKIAPPHLVETVVRKIPFEKWTLIAEFIHPQHRTVGMIDYGDLQALVLLFVRNLETLELVPATEIWRPDDLPQPLLLPLTYTDKDFWSLRDFIRNYPSFDFEGVVLQGASDSGNFLVKMKTTAYLERVRTLRNITPKRVIDYYEKQGMDGVNLLVGGVEELLDDTIRGIINILKNEEEQLRKEIEHLREKEIMEIPPPLRFVKSYPPDSPKFLGALWKIVANEVRRKLKMSG